MAIVLMLLSFTIPSIARRKPAELPRDPRDVPIEAQLTSTRSQADLNGDRVKELLILVNAMTGRSERSQASEVIFGIAAVDVDGQRGALHWVRHLARETGQGAHSGELTAVDLDGDGASELLLTWDRSQVPGRVDRWAEVYAVDDLTRPRRVWEGIWERDTRRDESVPKAEKEWFERDIDYGATRRAAGKALVIQTERKVLAGELLAKPRISSERVAVRLRH